MRKIYPENGALRVKTRFLWFPKQISYEIRWLEVATWEEEYCRASLWWGRIRWIDSDLYLGPQRTSSAPHRVDPRTGAKIPRGGRI